MLHTMLADVMATPMPVGTTQPLRLAQLTRDRRLAELEFHVHAPQLAAADLQRTLARLGYAMPTLGFGTLAGYLKGFVDLVFEHDDRYFIADWKSNHLGLTPDAYGQGPMGAAMAQHLYSLQSLIYCVALHRWLGQRLAGYDVDRHFGGALYLFVRGVRPGWRADDGQPSGVFFHRPTAQAIVELSALLAGEAITA
jgi:exodeoxyribonuclease V beta subunit